MRMLPGPCGVETHEDARGRNIRSDRLRRSDDRWHCCLYR
jgi:hypothetical protein